MNSIKNMYNHFVTITKHRHMVIFHAMKAGIWWLSLFHDLSKYSPEEFFVGAKFYSGNKSPNEGERSAYGYSKAWMHHKGRNKHHFEYWTDYNIQTKVMSPVKMPTKYLIEMFCDRVAASKIYQKENYTVSHPYDYFIHAKNTRTIHPETSKALEELLIMLRDKGEDETFKYIRTMKRN